MFVEAHTVGQDDWTTLPDKNGHTDTNVAAGSCDIDWDTIHPFVSHYQTNPTPANDCTNTGTTGVWNAATGNSGGFQDWEIDLSAYKGKQVEVSITYAQDFAVSGLGVFLDALQVVKDGAVRSPTASRRASPRGSPVRSPQAPRTRRRGSRAARSASPTVRASPPRTRCCGASAWKASARGRSVPPS